MGLLSVRLLIDVAVSGSETRQAKRLADERKVFSVEPQRQIQHQSHQSPGRRLCPGVRPLSPARREVNYMLKLFVAIQSKLAEVRSEEGQTMAEYGVVLAVITLVIVGTLLALSGAINGALEEVTGVL
jgi:Flp pilus assembly pilin Flp